MITLYSNLCMNGNETLFILAFKQLVELDKRLQLTTKRGYQPGSCKNLRLQINRYLDFCIDLELPPVPADELQLHRFAQYLADSLSINAIDMVLNYTSALKTLHKLVGLQPPSTSTFLAAQTIKRT